MPRMKNKGLFGKKPSFAMPSMQPEMPMGGGMNDLQTIMHSPQERQAAQPEQAKPGFLGKGGVGRAIAGTIGDYLMQREGMAPIYAPTMMQQQKARAEAAAAERERAMDLADFETKEGIKAKYDVPSIQQNAEYIERTEGPEAAAAYRRTYGRGPQQPNVVNIPGLGTFYGTPEEVAAAISAARGTGQQGGLPTFTEDDWNNAGGGAGNSAGPF